MDGKRTSILSDLKRNYGDTKSISKSVDLSALENNANPHQIYNSIFKDVDTTPSDYPTEKISVGDIVYINDNPNEQFEIINMNDKNNISLKNLSNNEIISKTQKDIKKIMENIDMAKKKINETQYSVSINGLETTDANALSQMMSAAAQADSGNADVGGMDMTSTPDLPTPENTIETLPQDDMGSLDSNTDLMTDTNTTVIPTDTLDTDEPSFEDSDLEGIDSELPSEIENPLDNPESEMDSFEDDIDMDSEMDMDEPVVDDIDFDEEIPSDEEIDFTETNVEEPNDDMELTETKDYISNEIDHQVLQELYDVICEAMGDDYLSDYDEVDHMELLDCVKDFGNDIEGFDDSLAEKYATALKSKWKEEHSDDGSDYEDYGRPNWEDDEDEEYEELDEDTVYDHSWYEVEGQKYPKRTKNGVEIKEGIKDWFKKDNRKYRIMYGTNGGWISKDKKHIVGDLTDTLIVTGLKKAERLAKYFDNGEEPRMFHPDEIKQTDKGWNFKYTQEFLDILEKVKNGEMSEEEAKNYFEKKGLPLHQYWIYLKLALPNKKKVNSDEEWDDEEINEDILLPKATEDETFNASKKLKDEDDEESERISESMDALIKSILENADAKSEQEIYAEEISEEKDDSKCCPKCGKEKCVCEEDEILDEDNDEFDVEISEALRNAGVKLEEATVKPTIVTDESSFANKPNKALKPEDKKTVEKKTVDTATFGKDASEGFKEPLNCIKCEAVSPKEKIKAIYETAKVRYSKANKDEWNALDRRYIKKLIENGCGYTRASKIILEAKKKK